MVTLQAIKHMTNERGKSKCSSLAAALLVTLQLLTRDNKKIQPMNARLGKGLYGDTAICPAKLATGECVDAKLKRCKGKPFHFVPRFRASAL
jgi:hypothetical protein